MELKKILPNKKAQGFIKGIIVLVVGITVGFIIWGALFPSGVTGLVAVNTSLQVDEGFKSASDMNLLLALFATLALVLVIIGVALKTGKLG